MCPSSIVLSISSSIYKEIDSTDINKAHIIYKPQVITVARYNRRAAPSIRMNVPKISEDGPLVLHKLEKNDELVCCNLIF